MDQVPQTTSTLTRQPQLNSVKMLETLISEHEPPGSHLANNLGIKGAQLLRCVRISRLSGSVDPALRTCIRGEGGIPIMKKLLPNFLL